MPRLARKKGCSGIYHVITRGINRQDVFLDRLDRIRFLEILRETKEATRFSLYGYCLMGNHVHLLLGEQAETISAIMHRLNTKYAVWHNRKHERCGHVFQNRFISEPVEDEGYLLTALRYIHQNPQKAGIVNSPLDYIWSSYRAYLWGDDYAEVRIDTALVLELMGGRERLISFTDEENSDSCLELEDDQRVRDEVISDLLSHLLAGANADTLQRLNRVQRDQIIRQLKAIKGASIRQVARLTGLGKTIVERV